MKRTIIETTKYTRIEFEKAQDLARNCLRRHGYRMCGECRLYLDCQLQSNVRQKQLNLEELEIKIKP